MKSLRLRIVITFVISSVVILMLMRLFHSFYVVYRPSYFFEGMTAFLPSVLVIMSICAVAIGISCSSLDKLWVRIKAGEELDRDDKKLARETISKIPRIIYLVNILGFFIGPIMTISLRLNGESFFQVMNIITVLYNTGLGLIAALFQIKASDIHLRRAKEGFNIHYIDEDIKCSSSSHKLLFTTLASLYLTMMLFIAGAIGYIINGANVITFNQLILRFAILFISNLLVVGIIIYTFVNDIPKQINIINKKLKDISDGSGDLSIRLSIIDFDEFGILTNRINRYIDSLKTLLIKVRNTCRSVSKISFDMYHMSGSIEESLNSIDRNNSTVASATLSQASLVNSADNKIGSVLNSIAGVSQKVNSQSSYVSTSSAAITQMVANIGSVSSIALKANSHSTELKSVSDKGQKAVLDTSEAFKNVEESSKEMKAIVAMISKVAAQTNLLAMNAAIEAAHAGESGKGFAVVADEVRKLAEDSGKSIRKIVELIKDMTSKIERGVSLSRDAESAFSQISKDIIRTTDLIETISSAMDEQQQGAQEILSSIDSLVEATDAIKDFSNRQMSESSDIEKSIGELKDHSNKISGDVDEQRESYIVVEDLTRKILSLTKSNALAVEELEDVLAGFNF